MIRRIQRKLKFLEMKSSVGSYDSFLRRHPAFEILQRSSFPIIRDRLLPVYKQYVRDVSAPEMAASLELGTFLFALCKANGYTQLVDLGSGFSSCVFRIYAQETPGVQVFSIDDDLHWLEKTRQFLTHAHLDTNSLMSMDEFMASGLSGFDLILHDLNFVEERIKFVNRLLPLVRPGGMIIWDDVHKPDYAFALLDSLLPQGGELFSLKPATQDEYGRYAMAYLRPK